MRRQINLPYPDTYSYISSPNGKSVLRWSPNAIEYFASITSGTYVTLFQPTKNEVINSLAWSPDSRTIAFTTTFSAVDSSGLGQIIQTKIYDLNLTRPARLILTTSNLFAFKITTFPTTDQVGLVQDSLGVWSHLRLLNLTTATYNSDYSFTDNEGLLARLRGQIYGPYTYYLTPTQLLKLDLNTTKTEALFTLDKRCPGSPDSNAALVDLSISPSGTKIVFSSSLVACPKTSLKAASTSATSLSDYKNAVYLFDTTAKALVGQTGERSARRPPSSRAPGRCERRRSTESAPARRSRSSARDRPRRAVRRER